MWRSLTLLFWTRRGVSLLIRNALSAFGLLAGLLQLALAIWTDFKVPAHERWNVLAALVAVSFVFGAVRAWPRREVSREITGPDIKVTVKVGNLFDQPTHLVIGFSDAFDTDTTNSVVIDQNSVQGQFQDRIYGNDLTRLDAEIDVALSGKTSIRTESPADKSAGKLARYPIGTVALLGDPARFYFCVAYTKMQNDLIASSNVHFLWQSLAAAWESVYLHGQRKPVSIPIVGAELARIACLNRESLLKMILLSFVARSREGLVCKELTVVIHPKDFHHINMLEVAAFLRTL